MGPAAIIAGVGSLVQGFGAFQSKRAQAAALKTAAKQARGEASMQAQLAADEGERAAARAAVMGAASGGGTQGSFAGVLEQLERTATFNARSALYAGNVEANNRLYEAKVAKADGTMALISSVFQAGSSLAGDAMRGAENRKQAGIRRGLYARGYGR
jgi:hypothetical protein